MKICNKILFNIGHSIFFPIFLIIIIIMCIILFFKFKEKLKKISTKYKFLIFLVLLSLFIFILAVFFVSFDTSVGCRDKVKNKLSIEEIKDIQRKQKLTNHIIVMGDSRMDLLRNERDKVDVPNYVSFIALNGAKYDWFKNDALKELKKELDENQNKKYYHVIINFGVNDLQEDDTNKYVNEYYNDVLELARDYPKVDFYYMSVNPIQKQIIKHFPDNNRTNDKIKDFNYLMKQKIILSKKDNLWYCNSHDHIKFQTYDGLHYDTKTNKEITKYIINDCVIYH